MTRETVVSMNLRRLSNEFESQLIGHVRVSPFGIHFLVIRLFLRYSPPPACKHHSSSATCDVSAHEHESLDRRQRARATLEETELDTTSRRHVMQAVLLWRP